MNRFPARLPMAPFLKRAPAIRFPRRLAAAAVLLAFGVIAAGCTTGPPAQISYSELQSAQHFPYYRLYWVGLRFDQIPVTATDGLEDYKSSIGDSIDYGNCDPGHGFLHTGECVLPLIVTTVVYLPHSNQSLGPQRNILIRGAPATIYNNGKSIEVYTGRLAIDVYADTAARALQAARMLAPINAPGTSRNHFPAPDYCPGLVGPAPLYNVARQPDGRLDCISTATSLLLGKS
jgi:hypothetical protein